MEICRRCGLAAERASDGRAILDTDDPNGCNHCNGGNDRSNDGAKARCRCANFGEHNVNGELALRLGDFNRPRLAISSAAGSDEGLGEHTTASNDVAIGVNDLTVGVLVHDGTDAGDGTLLLAKEGGGKSRIHRNHAIVLTIVRTFLGFVIDDLDGSELATIALALEVVNGSEGDSILGALEVLDVHHLDVIGRQGTLLLFIGGEANTNSERTALRKEGIVQIGILHAYIVLGALACVDGIRNINDLGSSDDGFVLFDSDIAFAKHSQTLAHIVIEICLHLLLGDVT